MKRKTRKMKWIALLMAAALVLTTTQSGLVAAVAEEETTGTACELTEGCTLENGHEGECVVEETTVSVTLESVQALIDALPEASEITSDNTSDVEAQLDAIDAAKSELYDAGGDVDSLNMTKYDAACAALTALEGEENGEPEIVTEANTTSVAQIGGTPYETVAAALSAAGDGDTITLLSDTSLDSLVTLSNGHNITLDLANYTLTANKSIALKHGSLTVQNGTVTGSQPFNVYGSETDEANYSVLTIASTATIKDASWGICLFPVTNSKMLGYGAVINIYGKLDNCNTGIFVSGNLGNSAETAESMASSSNASVVNVYEGAVFTTSNQCIPMNGYAIVNIYGGSLTGSEAIGVKRGVLNVYGGTLTATGAYVDPAEANHNGTESTGSAISVTSTYNYAGVIKVNVSGGTIQSSNNAAVYVGHSKETSSYNAYTKGIVLSLIGGTYVGASGVGDVYVADAIDGDASTYTKQIVSGGYYSTVVDDAYPASGYTADTKATYDANGNSGSTYYSVHKHDTTYMTYVAATAATCAATGNTAYYYCPYCDSYYTDANGTNATTLEAVTIAIDSANHSESWSNPVWSWSSDYSTATATFTCEYLASHTETVNATITSTESDSQIVYTATVERSDGTVFTDTHIELKTVEAEVSIVSTEADVSAVSAENQETAKSVADTIDIADESQVENLVTAISEENAETYKDVAASALKDAGATLTDSTVITIVTEVYLTKTVKEIVTTEGSKSITVDITLNSVVKATTDDGGEAILQDETAIQLAQGQAIDIEIDITDMGFENEDILYVGHDSSYGYYYYKPTFSTVSGRRIATFTNLHGFSDFTISEDSRTATVIYNYTDGSTGTVTYTPENVGVSLPVLSKDGYTFNGWTFEGIDGTYTTLTDDLLTALSDLYAKNGTAITATAVFTSNATTTSTSTTTAVKTGDTNSMGMYLALIVVCMAGLIGTAAVRRKKRI
ncbi:MAG: InlB B-repeat-containing protein [Clostridiales bacterium]|nr:InlB B-repeat-containing protein [Clostridiales bacterium]